MKICASEELSLHHSMDPQCQARGKQEIPCAACRLLHRKCMQGCMLAPYFPAEEPEKFAIVHKVFGASNVIKMIQAVEEARREDAVKSMVYEACARIRDPVFGCTSAIFYLQKYVEGLTGELKAIREQVIESQAQMDQLYTVLMDVSQLNCCPSSNLMSAANDLLFENMIHGGSLEILMD